MGESRFVSMGHLTRQVLSKARAGITPLRSRSSGTDPIAAMSQDGPLTDQADGDDCAEEGYFLLGIDQTDAIRKSACPSDDAGIDDDVRELIDSETGEYPAHPDLMVSSAMMAAIDDPEDLALLDEL